MTNENLMRICLVAVGISAGYLAGHESGTREIGITTSGNVRISLDQRNLRIVSFQPYWNRFEGYDDIYDATIGISNICTENKGAVYTEEGLLRFASREDAADCFRKLTGQ